MWLYTHTHHSPPSYTQSLTQTHTHTRRKHSTKQPAVIDQFFIFSRTAVDYRAGDSKPFSATLLLDHQVQMGNTMSSWMLRNVPCVSDLNLHWKVSYAAEHMRIV